MRAMAYDLAIIGGGPDGMSAAVYAARFRLKTFRNTRVGVKNGMRRSGRK